MNPELDLPDHGLFSANPALARLLDALPIGVILLDSEGRARFANAAARERLSLQWSSVEGTSLFREILPILGEEGLEEEYRAGVRSDELALSWAGAIRGERLTIDLRAFGAEAGPWGLAVIQDAAVVGDDAARIRRLERLASVGEMTESAAHEINNPLASIRSFAQLLAGGTATDEQRQALGMIVEETARIAQIVDNVIDFAREHGVGGQESLNLSAVVREVVEAERGALQEAGVEVRLDLDQTLTPVLGDENSLKQAVQNLILYARDGLAGRSQERLLILRTRESSEGVILSVFHNGPGIARDELPHIFDSLRAAKLRGVGLRLAITATIVREHGGQIVAESDEGRGTAFFVRLPWARVPKTPTQQPPPPATPPEPRRDSLRVLVADDESTLRLAIALFLQRRGHQVTQASNAHEAWKLAQEAPFDAALVDVRMPGDGLALLEKLNTIPALRGRSVMMTGDLAYARTHQGLKEGRPYLVKPFDMNAAVELLETLARTPAPDGGDA